MSDRVLKLQIVGDARSALKAFAETAQGGGILQGKLAGLNPTAMAAGAAIGAAAIGAGKALYGIGEQFDGAYDHIRTATGKTGVELDRLKNDFRAVVKDVPTDFDSASKAVAFINQKLDLTGKVGREVSGQFLELSRITGSDLSTNMQAGTDAINAFNVSGKDAPFVLDTMFKASQKSGLAFADIASQVANASTTLRPFGFTIDGVTALVATLGKEGLSTSDVMPALGKALGVAAKEGKDASKFLGETFERIKGAKDDTAAAGVAVEIFGAKAGPKFAALIRDGKLGYEDMLRSIRGGGDSIRKAGTETQDLGEKWTKIKNQVFLALEPIATRLFDAVGGLADKFANLSPGVQQAIVVGAGLIAVLGGIGVAVAVLGPVFAGIGAAIGLVFSPIGLVIAAVALVTFLIIRNWDTIKAATSAAWGAISDAVSGAVRFIWNLFLNFTPLGQIVKNFDTIVSFVRGLPGKIASAASGMWDGITNAFKRAINAVIGLWNRFTSKLKIPSVGVGPLKTPAVDIGSRLQIPLLAKGGTALTGGYSIVGEEGPELRYLPTGASVIPLNRGGMPGWSAGTGGEPTSLEVPVYLNGREIARAIVDDLHTELLKKKKRNGAESLSLAGV